MRSRPPTVSAAAVLLALFSVLNLLFPFFPIEEIPAVTLFPEFAQMGGLLAYGPDLQGLFRQAATLTQKVLDGASPKELPIERPERFQLVANLETATYLGLTFPNSIVVRSDEVIE